MLPVEVRIFSKFVKLPSLPTQHIPTHALHTNKTAMAATLAVAAARRIRVVASTCKACRYVAWTYPQGSYRSFHAVPTAYAPPPPDHPAFGAGIATSLRNAYLATTSAVAALLDPERGDMVATLGEATGELALRNMLDQMKADAGGRAILRDRPRIRQDTIDVDTLRLLPHDTLGFAYAKFLDTHGYMFCACCMHVRTYLYPPL